MVHDRWRRSLGSWFRWIAAAARFIFLNRNSQPDYPTPGTRVATMASNVILLRQSEHGMVRTATDTLHSHMKEKKKEKECIQEYIVIYIYIYKLFSYILLCILHYIYLTSSRCHNFNHLWHLQNFLCLDTDGILYILPLQDVTIVTTNDICRIICVLDTDRNGIFQQVVLWLFNCYHQMWHLQKLYCARLGCCKPYQLFEDDANYKYQMWHLQAVYCD